MVSEQASTKARSRKRDLAPWEFGTVELRVAPSAKHGSGIGSEHRYPLFQVDQMNQDQQDARADEYPMQEVKVTRQ
jgi:hypothetical protein